MLSTVPRPPSRPAGYIISAWAKDGRLAVGRCAEPEIPDLGQREMVKSWVVRDTSKAFGRATFGDDFSHAGPSCVYGGSCANPPAGEKYPGAWAVRHLAGCWTDQSRQTLALADPRAAVEAAIADPETPLDYTGAEAALGLANSVLRAFRDVAPKGGA